MTEAIKYMIPCISREANEENQKVVVAEVKGRENGVPTDGHKFHSRIMF